MSGSGDLLSMKTRESSGYVYGIFFESQQCNSPAVY